ncbi:MAG: hypothetical protein U0Z53_23715 [Blastocatellia bacterium]
MGHELPRIEAWIYSRLTADATITARIPASAICAYRAPEGTPLPFIIFSYQAGGDVQGLGTARTLTRAIYQIKLVCQGAPAEADLAIADRLDTIFQTAVTETQQGWQFTSRRERPLSYVETLPASSELIFHLGGLYVIATHPSP